MESCCSCNRFPDPKDEQNGGQEEELLLETEDEEYSEEYSDEEYSDEENTTEEDTPADQIFRSMTKEKSKETDGEKLLEDLEAVVGAGWKEQEWNLENEDVVLMLEHYLEEERKKDK